MGGILAKKVFKGFGETHYLLLYAIAKNSSITITECSKMLKRHGVNEHKEDIAHMLYELKTSGAIIIQYHLTATCKRFLYNKTRGEK